MPHNSGPKGRIFHFLEKNHMALTSTPFGKLEIKALFGIDILQGVGTRSSVWLILEAFTRLVEGVASRLAFGPTGVILMITIPGQPNTGTFYFYDNNKKTFSELRFENHESGEFNPTLFDIAMTTYDLQMLIDRPPVVEKKPVQYHGENHNNGRRRRHRGRGQNHNQQVRIGDVAAAA
jgi:hypothetical protein